MTGFSIHALRRSGRRSARGERLLRTPGIRAYLTTRPGRGGGTTNDSLANRIPHLVLVLQPRWGGSFWAGPSPRGSQKRSPLANFLAPLWGGGANKMISRMAKALDVIAVGVL